MARPCALPASRLILPLVATLAACGGQSCSCLGPIPGGFPTDSRRHEDAMQVRVTSGAVDYLAQNGKQLVTSLLPGGGSTFQVPPSGCPNGKNQVCCPNGMPGMCAIDLGITNVQLVPKPPSALAFTLTTSLKSKDPLPV